MKKTIETIMEKEFTPLEKVMALGCALMVGFVLGFLLSPVKKGIMIGSQNGCNNHHNGCGNYMEKDKGKQKA